MTIPNSKKVYPRSNDDQTIYLKSVITRDNIEVGDYTIYNDYYKDPRDFEKNNVLYQYPVNHILIHHSFSIKIIFCFVLVLISLLNFSTIQSTQS